MGEAGETYDERTNDPAAATRKPIALIGAPTDIGAGHRGSSMGPEALRVAGIEAALGRLGCKAARSAVGSHWPEKWNKDACDWGASGFVETFGCG